ncbi:MAG TPA: prephenate dehydrogenase/arogenate dehydrogenase family protein [Armatimonadota bacterium]|nr:prephenate dehydrogenase/arogenate dehydrogenase family protein [Armatimonadota bacterium]
MFDTVAIVGIGLIGGSLGMALRERGLARRVLGIPRRANTIDEALSVGAIDEGTLDLGRVADAELVVLAPPVLAIPPLVEAMAPFLRPGTVLTDVGSTKSALMRGLLPLLPDHADLVGGHPMAGSEKGGVLAGSASLFEGAIYVLTRTPRTRDENVERLVAMVRRLGATPVEMDPDLHDAAVARISHLPHVAAAALADATAGHPPGAGALRPEVLRMLVAGGFKSTTRIAASPPEMWRDICLTNREAILAALTDFETSLGRFRAALEEASPESLLQAFQNGKTARDFLVPPDERTPGGQ